MPPFDFSTEWPVHLPKMPQWQHFLGLRCHHRQYKVVLGHTQNSDWGLHWWQILQISQLFSKKPRNDDQNLKITADKWNSEISIYQISIPLTSLYVMMTLVRFPAGILFISSLLLEGSTGSNCILSTEH